MLWPSQSHLNPTEDLFEIVERRTGQFSPLKNGVHPFSRVQRLVGLMLRSTEENMANTLLRHFMLVVLFIFFTQLYFKWEKQEIIRGRLEFALILETKSNADGTNPQATSERSALSLIPQKCCQQHTQ